jgi:hypothetical protein
MIRKRKPIRDCLFIFVNLIRALEIIKNKEVEEGFSRTSIEDGDFQFQVRFVTE